MPKIFAKSALLPAGWQENVLIAFGDDGKIADISIEESAPNEAYQVNHLLPALSNLHSHAFQRAMAGLTEKRGAEENDSFWSWRKWMYRFAHSLSPDDVRIITAQVQMEMLEAGFAAVGEFHYLHHDQSGQHYDNIAEMAQSIVAAAEVSGIGLTLLPVLYQQGGVDGRTLSAEQQRFGNSLQDFQLLQEQSQQAVASLRADSVCGVGLHSLRAVSREALAFFDNECKKGPLHIHIAEQMIELDEVKTCYGTTPVQWLLDHCAVDSRWCLIHATHMTEAETIGLAKSHAVAGLCPITEASLGDGIFNGVVFDHAGGRFGIGSDSNVRISLSEELRLYEYTQRLNHRQRTLLAKHEGSNGRYLYDKAAAGGAQALRRKSGAIQVGMWADLLGIQSDNSALVGRDKDTLLDSWIFSADDRLVNDVWSAGKHQVIKGIHVQREQISEAFMSTMHRILHLY